MKRHGMVKGMVCGMIISGLAVPFSADAKPKRTWNGCTQEQLQTSFAGSCLDQNVTDAIRYPNQGHVMVCNGSDVQCCTVNVNTGQVISCRHPAGGAAGFQTQSTGVPKTGAVMGRGLEEGGPEGGDESDPLPAWLNEAWMKENYTGKISDEERAEMSGRTNQR